MQATTVLTLFLYYLPISFPIMVFKMYALQEASIQILCVSCFLCPSCTFFKTGLLFCLITISCHFLLAHLAY